MQNQLKDHNDKLIKIELNIKNILTVLNKIESNTENQNELNSELRVLLYALKDYSKNVEILKHSAEEIVGLKKDVKRLNDSLTFVRKTVIGAIITGLMTMLLSYNFNQDKVSKQPVYRVVKEDKKYYRKEEETD